MVDREIDEMCCMVATVEENKKKYSERQFKDAKVARALYRVLGCPTVENFKHILKLNLIHNCPVTAKHVDIAEDIFGPDIGALRGKSTRPNPARVQHDWIEIPKEIKAKHQDIVFCFDLMYINGLPMSYCYYTLRGVSGVSQAKWDSRLCFA